MTFFTPQPDLLATKNYRSIRITTFHTEDDTQFQIISQKLKSTYTLHERETDGNLHV